MENKQKENNLYDYFCRQNPAYRLSFEKWAEDLFQNKLTQRIGIELFDKNGVALTFWQDDSSYFIKYGKTIDKDDLRQKIEEIAPSIMVRGFIPISEELLSKLSIYASQLNRLNGNLIEALPLRVNELKNEIDDLVRNKMQFDFNNTAITNKVGFILLFDEIKIELIHTSADGVITNESVTTEFASRTQNINSDIYYREERVLNEEYEPTHFRSKAKKANFSTSYRQEPVRVKSKSQYTLASISVENYTETIQEIIAKNLSQNAYQFLRRSNIKLEVNKTYKITYRYETEKTMRIFCDKDPVQMILCGADNIHQTVCVELPMEKRVKAVKFNNYYLEVTIKNTYDVTELFNTNEKVIKGNCFLDIILLKPFVNEKDVEIHIETEKWI